ncbi:MAG: hypothetical protein NTZ16_00120 [Verrucomicrobia bacterium]|nr:hypothetical protein [Verrucomicrobiota bacterium]
MSQAAPPANWLAPLLDDSARFVSVNARDNLILLAALAALTLLLVAVILLRRRRRSRPAELHRSPWPASAGKNRPHPAPLIATGAFRQRRRRSRRSGSAPKPG